MNLDKQEQDLILEKLDFLKEIIFIKLITFLFYFLI